MRSSLFLSSSLLLVSAMALRGAAPAAPAEIALSGPEVVKLDWNTRSLQTADINGDGLLDLIVANNDRSSIDVLVQQKPGAKPAPAVRSLNVNRWEPVLEDSRFRKSSITTGITVYDLVAGDLNGDGRADLVYTGDQQPLTIRYQQANGDWQEKKITEAPDPIQLVGAIKIADLNGDKRADFVMLGQKELAIFYQDKKGALEAPERYALPDDNCYGLEVADANGDGRPDLIYLCSVARDSMRVRYQTPDHEFGPEQAYNIKQPRCTLQIIPSPADGKQVLTFTFAQENTGQFEEAALEPAKPTESLPLLRPRVFSPRSGSRTPFAYALGDFNGDGREDVAVSDPDGAQVFVYLRQKDGGFTGAKKYPVFADARSISAGDWDGDGRDELFVASAKEQAVGVASFNNDGRLLYPKPLPATGKHLAIAAGRLDTTLAGKGCMLADLREEKGKRFIDVWVRENDSGKLVKSIELTGLKTDPRAIRLVDANQDGRLDIAVFTPLDALRIFVQGDKFEFTELSTSAGFRKGLVDNLESAALSLGDIDGDGKNELMVTAGSFARALKVTSSGELTVVDQFNARDPSAEVSCSLVLPMPKAKAPVLAFYDKKTDQFQILTRGEESLYQVADTVPAGKIEVVGSEVLTDGKSGVEAFVFGKDRFWWMPLSRPDYVPVTVRTHATDLPEIGYFDVVAGDLTGDGRPEMVCVDPNQNLIEVLGRGADDHWESRMHFKIFETDQHFRGKKNSNQEPRETLIKDVTGDGKNDLILLVHDRVLIYPRE